MWKAAWLTLALALVTAPAIAADRTLTYKVEHPLYGEIGTYTDEFRDDGPDMQLFSRLRIAVRVLGIVLYREDSDRTEIWRGGRLRSITSTTQTNGQPMTLRGEASREGFVLDLPSGRILAPKDIWPTDAWAIRGLGTGVVFSTRTGKVDDVTITGGESETQVFAGKPVAVRHFHVHTARQRDKWEAWLDPNGIALKFRSVESGSPVDFTLISRKGA